MTPTNTWHLTTQQQIGSAFVCAFVVAIILYGLWTVWTDWQREWSIDDLIDDFFADPDPHAVDDRAAMRKARAR